LSDRDYIPEQKRGPGKDKAVKRVVPREAFSSLILRTGRLFWLLKKETEEKEELK
jgi:hypothetical protein